MLRGFGRVVGFHRLSLKTQILILSSRTRFLSQEFLLLFAPNGSLPKLEKRLRTEVTAANASTVLVVLAWISLWQMSEIRFPRLILEILGKGELPASVVRDCFGSCAHPFYFGGRFDVAEEVQLILVSELDRMLNRSKGLRQETAHFSAIGHNALLDYLVKATVLGIVPSENLELVVGHHPIANRTYADLWIPELRKLGIRVSEQTESMAEPNLEVWPTAHDGYVPACSLYGTVEAKWKQQHRAPILELPESVSTNGHEALCAAGFDPDKWFVGLHLRSGRSPERQLRNSTISKFQKSIEEIIIAGGQVVIVGDLVDDETLPRIPNLVDTRGMKLSDIIRESIHIFVWAKARFFVGNLSGGTHPPRTFGTPTLWVDLHPSAHFRPPHPEDIYIPKLIRSREKNRFLSLKELYSPAHFYAQTESTEFAAKKGYEIRDSSEVEIQRAVGDMLTQTLKGQNQPTPLDLKLDSIASLRGLGMGARMAPSFIEEWKAILFADVGA